MNALLLKREIETMLGLSGLPAFRFWQSLPPPPQPTGPTPIPYPNLAVSEPSQPAGSRVDGRNYVKRLVHVVDSAASGEAATVQAWPLWLRIKGELAAYPGRRSGLAHELTHVLQQRGSR
jgi:hypothetical protein